MANSNSPYSGGDTPELTVGLNADTVDGCHVSNDSELSTSSGLIPTSGAAKTYIDGNINNHSLLHTDNFYTKTETETMISNADLIKKNYIINGAMEICQRGTTFPYETIGVFDYTLDRWVYLRIGLAYHTVSQSVQVPENGPFSFSLEAEVGSTAGGVEHDHAYALVHKMEGYFFSPLVGKQATLSFWVKAAKVGTHCVSFTNWNFDMWYVAEYEVLEADAWEFKEISVTFDYSGGSWDYTTGAGLLIYFVLGCGSDYHTTAGTWQLSGTDSYFATENQVDETDETGNSFSITGVMLNEGPSASDFRYVGGSFVSELELCRRYYETAYPLGEAPGYEYPEDSIWNMRVAKGTTGFYNPTIRFSVPKRICSYIVTFYTPAGAKDYIRRVGVGDIAYSSMISAALHNECIMTGSSLVDGELYSFFWECDCEI